MSQIPIVENDLDVFFVDGEFAQDVKLNGLIFSAIITDFYDPLDGGEVGIEGANILLICKTSDVLNVMHNDLVEVENENYLVVNIRPENSGITRLKLARAFIDVIPPGVVTYNGEIVTYNSEEVTYGII